MTPSAAGDLTRASRFVLFPWRASQDRVRSHKKSFRNSSICRTFIGRARLQWVSFLRTPEIARVLRLFLAGFLEKPAVAELLPAPPPPHLATPRALYRMHHMAYTQKPWWLFTHAKLRTSDIVCVITPQLPRCRTRSRLPPAKVAGDGRTLPPRGPGGGPRDCFSRRIAAIARNPGKDSQAAEKCG